MNKNNNFLSIQCLRAVAALLVLACHTGAIEGKYMQGTRWTMEWGAYGVDLFFVISGFIMTYVSRDMQPCLRAVGRFMLRRVFRIYPVYWQFTGVIIAVMVVRPEWLNMLEGGATPSITKSLLLWPQMTDPLLGVAWSLVYEMYFYVVLCVGLLVLGRHVRYGCIGWCIALLVCGYFDVSRHAQSAEMKLITSPFGLEFIVGCCAAWLYMRGVKISPWVLLGTSICWAVVAFSYGMAVYGTVVYYHEVMMRVIALAVPSALLLYALLMLELQQVKFFPRWLCAVGDASYSLYLLHSLLLSAMGKLWIAMKLETHISSGLYVTLMAACAIVFSLINYRLFEQPVSRFTHRLLRSR